MRPGVALVVRSVSGGSELDPRQGLAVPDSCLTKAPEGAAQLDIRRGEPLVVAVRGNRLTQLAVERR
jgi:hypothetical protein